MKRNWLSAMAGVLILAATTCSPKTKLAMDWEAPQKPARPFDTVVAIAMSRDNILRRIAEDEFVERLPEHTKTTRGVTGYSIIPDSDKGDVEKVKTRLRDAQVDGAVVFRLVDVDTQVYANQGGYYASFWGYYGWAYPVVYSPGYMMTEEVVRVEATVYNVDTAELVWTSMTELTDPKSSQKIIADVVRLVIGKMRARGLVE